MYKLLIIDDEISIREGLTNIVDWNALGFKVICCLEDGDEAFEYIDRNDIDVILTDIKMSRVSGIDLAKYICEKKKEVRIVFMSGYRDFEYAKQGIRYNVTNYILKPTSLDDIEETFISLKNTLDEENRKKEIEDTEKRQGEEALFLLRQQLFTDIIMGVLKDLSQLKERFAAAFFDLEILNKKCCVVCIMIKRGDAYTHKYGKEGLLTAIGNFIPTKEEEICYYKAYNKKNNFWILAVNENDLKKFECLIINCFQQIKKNLLDELEIEIDFKLGKIYQDMYELAQNYNFINESIFLHTPAVQKDKEELLEEHEKLLISYVHVGNYQMVKQVFVAMMEQCQGMNLKIMQNFIINLFSVIHLHLKEINVDVFQVMNGNFTYDMITNLNSIYELKSFSLNILNNIIDFIIIHRMNSDKDVIYHAKQYINENYSSDISLNDVSNHVFLSPSHFSRLFKKEIGENFIDYLIKVRMEKAIILLKDCKYKTYEISEMVGYKKSKYFSRLFKNYTGYTPSEYRNEYLKVQ